MQSSNNRHAVKNAVLETLESRWLFAATAESYRGIIIIKGTTGDDNIVLSGSGSNLKVVLNTTKTVTFPSANIYRIEVSLFEGNDKFTSDNSVTQPMKVDGNFGKDTITTGGGDDDIFSGNDDDKVNGGNGNDTIDGGYGNDTINGNGGNDSLFDGTGSDSVFGEAGNDIFNAGVVSVGSDFYDGGDGNDQLLYTSRTSGVVITTDGVANDGAKPSAGYASAEKDNVQPNIEVFNTTKQADRIKLSGNVKNSIYTSGGSDFVDAGPGDDYVSTGPGTPPGNATVYGGSGNDTIRTDSGGDDIYGGDGNDDIIAYQGDDYIAGGGGNDSITAQFGMDRVYGEAGNDTINGGDQNDYLSGGDGNDVINGEGGTDYVYGGNGDDQLVGGSGYDYLYGDAGNDLLYCNDNVFNEIVNGGSGADIAVIDKLTFPYYSPGELLTSIEVWY